jgi:hypothetical protein
MANDIQSSVERANLPVPRTLSPLQDSHIEEALSQVLVLDHRQLQGIALECSVKVRVHLATAHEAQQSRSCISA